MKRYPCDSGRQAREKKSVWHVDLYLELKTELETYGVTGGMMSHYMERLYRKLFTVRFHRSGGVARRGSECRPSSGKVSLNSIGHVMRRANLR